MKKLIFSIFAISIFFACNKLDLPEGTPDCIEKEICEFKSSYDDCMGMKVSRFDTQVGVVYYFDYSSCGGEAYADVYDENCNQICSLGGIVFVPCKSDTIFLTFSNELIIWEN
ncbi:MAG: hypothetical protein HY842_09260 [Bacteroidetes bacterium]|nr:hypothetical protein [Bacteroidota bacterium]